MKERYTALYERLSRDDEQQGESNSILNQKKYLEDYARSKGFRNIRHFSDDGFTHTVECVETVQQFGTRLGCVQYAVRSGEGVHMKGDYDDKGFLSIRFGIKGKSYGSVDHQLCTPCDFNSCYRAYRVIHTAQRGKK